MAPFLKRIVVTGAESTGKTTLARQLGNALGLPVVAEFAREYASEGGGLLSVSDVEPIARGQLAAQRRAPAAAVFDTDLVSTWVYARHYYQWTPEWLDEHVAMAAESFYLFCDVDLPWVFDPVRDPLADRATIHGLFQATLEELGHRWALVRGFGDERLAAALRALAASGEVASIHPG